MLGAARYLANRPEGWPEVYLIASVVLAAIAATLAGWQRDVWRFTLALAIGLLPLALLRPV